VADVTELVKRVVFYALRTVKAGAGALYLVESDGATLRAHGSSGVFPPLSGELGSEYDRAFSKIRYVEDLIRTRAVRFGEGVVGECAATGRAILVPDAELDSRLPRLESEFLKLRTVLAVPMRFRDQVLGVVVVTNRVDELPFSSADLSLLQALADQASVAIYYAKFSAALDEKRRLDYDLGVANRIQSALLPKELPALPGAELGALSVPAQQVGGDYYDVVPIADGQWGLAIADVSGKGVTGAMVMTMCRSLLRALAPGRRSPADLLRAVNAQLSPDLSEDMYITMLYMVYDGPSRCLRWARAGQPPAVLIPGNRGEPRNLESGGLALGLADPETFDAVLEDRAVALEPGDLVMAFTDGVTEARDQRANEWGLLNLVKAGQIAAMEGRGAEATTKAIRQRLLQFVGDTPQYDDITLVTLRVTQ
jgi:sigma-B regulation protein RsbU (phosphoserine phosphatase)